MMDDIKSVVHSLKSFAQDAAQPGRALARGVRGGGVQRAWPLVRVARGKHHLTLESFNELNTHNFRGLKGALLPWLKRKCIWGAKNVMLSIHFLSKFISRRI